MKMMITYRDLDTSCDQEKTRRYFKNEKGETERCEIQYTTIFANHFKYRHIIDNNNNLRYFSPSFEETWVNHRWPNRVFAFFLAVAKVNAFLAFRFGLWSTPAFTNKAPMLHQFFQSLPSTSSITTSSKMRRRILQGRPKRGRETITCSLHRLTQRNIAMEDGALRHHKNINNMCAGKTVVIKR